ncbi:phosphatase domain-containing protein [Desertibaculum subflavum]|uniref:phosphatase domain-containing protein n=1 Tax=Desertibaculum subflavum TaxID=2268458 RepID=UPI000E6633B0
MRTSKTHPLQIATASITGTLGRIGITFCPGKYDPAAMTGGWDRDLAADVQAIQRWGASTLICLLERHEIELLRVTNLKKAVEAADIRFMHLPIRDGGIPDHTFEGSWKSVCPTLHDEIESGGSILVHCRGGLGRAGLVAARLLIEFGMAPAAAMRAVRAVRSGAIETTAQEQYVLALREAGR